MVNLYTIKNILSLIILLVLCSCGHRHLSKAGYYDPEHINDTGKKYGVVLLRPMYFIDNNDSEKFTLKASNEELNVNQLFVEARSIPDLGSYFVDSYAIGGLLQGPKSFYTVTMLPEGEYCIAYIRVDAVYHKNFYKEFHKDDQLLRFTVKAGQINYLGDLHFIPFKKASTSIWSIFSDYYAAHITIIDDSKRAKLFIKEFYPELKLKFVKNLLKESHKETEQNYYDLEVWQNDTFVYMMPYNYTYHDYTNKAAASLVNIPLFLK